MRSNIIKKENVEIKAITVSIPNKLEDEKIVVTDNDINHILNDLKEKYNLLEIDLKNLEKIIKK